MATAAAVIAQTAAFLPEFITMAGSQAVMATDLTGILALQTADQFENIAAGVIIAGLQVILQQKYVDLAGNYRDLYSAQRDYYYNNFQDGGSDTAFTERGLLATVFAIPPYAPQYQQQATALFNFHNMGFSNVWWVNHAAMYATQPFVHGLNARRTGQVWGEPEGLDEWVSYIDYTNYLYRYEEHRKDVYDERTWERQNQSLNYGVKQANVAQSGLATSFPFLDKATENMADWMATQANGISKYSGYRSALASTTDRLHASALRGSSLALSTNVGVDVGYSSTQNYYRYQYSNENADKQQRIDVLDE